MTIDILANDAFAVCRGIKVRMAKSSMREVGQKTVAERARLSSIAMNRSRSSAMQCNAAKMPVEDHWPPHVLTKTSYNQDATNTSSNSTSCQPTSKSEHRSITQPHNELVAEAISHNVNSALRFKDSSV